MKKANPTTIQLDLMHSMAAMYVKPMPWNCLQCKALKRTSAVALKNQYRFFLPFFFTLKPGAPPEPDVFHGS